MAIAHRRAATLYALADRYRVRMLHVAVAPRAARRAPNGPFALLMEPPRTLVIIGKAGLDAILETPEDAVHELAHCIVHPNDTGFDREDFPEDYMLLQFERALVKHAFDPAMLAPVIQYQENTHSGFNSEVIGAPTILGTGYHGKPFWEDGFGRCQQVGLLDAKRRPTYRAPDWSRWPYRSFVQEDGDRR